jgi:hypothetical protein
MSACLSRHVHAFGDVQCVWRGNGDANGIGDEVVLHQHLGLLYSLQSVPGPSLLQQCGIKARARSVK